MDVYYNKNGNIWRRGKQAEKLTKIPICKTFFWEEQEIDIPAIYVGKAGVILDVCAKISLEEMFLFLKKWDKEKRLSLRTQEEYEQLEADNPSSKDFIVQMHLDGKPLTLHICGNLRWYPPVLFQMEADENFAPAIDADASNEDKIIAEEDSQNDKNAIKLMEAYHCDKSCCWYFGRLIYNWNEEIIFSPKEVSLLFQSNPMSITAKHFSTDIFCDTKILEITHPKTGQEYTLTLYGCEQMKNSFEGIATEGVHYPPYCQALSYSVLPELDFHSLEIRDCAESDQPRMEDAPERFLGGSCGPTSIFIAGKNPNPNRRTACSSLHFEPVTKINWRVVFQVKAKEDMEIKFPTPFLYIPIHR